MPRYTTQSSRYARFEKIGNLPIERCRKEVILEAYWDVVEDLLRKDGTISDMLDRNAHIRSEKDRQVRVIHAPKKKRGEFDAIGKKKLISRMKGDFLLSFLGIPGLFFGLYQSGDITGITDPTALVVCMYYLYQQLSGPILTYVTSKYSSYE